MKRPIAGSFISTLITLAVCAVFFLGCTNDSAPNYSHKKTSDAHVSSSLRFLPVGLPQSDELKRKTLASNGVVINGKTFPISYQKILRSGDVIDEQVFGRIVDRQGQPIIDESGQEIISVYPDFSSLIPTKNKTLNMITHFEETPGTLYLTSLDQDASNGTLKPIGMSPITAKEVGGIWMPCSGVVTTWNTHLGAEEFPPDGRKFEAATSLDSLPPRVLNMARFFLSDPNHLKVVKSEVNPYKYGYTYEIAINEQASFADENYTKTQKHYSMGRLSQELAYIMPDQKTVYISDDGTNVGFFMYVADRPRDLSAGTLYALKWHQLKSDAGWIADAEWINLGHSTDAEIASAIEAKIQFSDLFEVAAPLQNEKPMRCPESFVGINTDSGAECLRLKNGMESIASRLETRRYAAYRGATTELRKEEGITYNPHRQTLYVAMSEISRGMEDRIQDGRFEQLGPNDIRLKTNLCGAVYAMRVEPDPQIGSLYVAKTVRVELEGIPHSYTSNSGLQANHCSVNHIANPDNLTFMPEYNQLIIGEDSIALHQTDVLWAYDLNSKQLSRIQTTPYGAETAGLHWFGNRNGFGYLMSIVQHPYVESDRDKLRNHDERKATVGYLGPFPVK